MATPYTSRGVEILTVPGQTYLSLFQWDCGNETLSLTSSGHAGGMMFEGEGVRRMLRSSAWVAKYVERGQLGHFERNAN